MGVFQARRAILFFRSWHSGVGDEIALAEREVPIFAVSTFDTDYVLVGEENVEIALQVLRDAGHQLVS